MNACEFSRDRFLRIGLFGGTFNPIHRGHFQAAMDVLQLLQLDCIFFIPSSLPPHKSRGKLASAEDRLQMVRLALSGHDRLNACDTEIKRTGPSYSIDTVKSFKAAAPEDARVFFMLGLDAFWEIHTWKDYERLFEETALVVMSRPGAGQWTGEKRLDVEAYVRRHISSAYEWGPGGDVMVHPHRCNIYFASVTPVNISSSHIRSMIRGGASINSWVAPAVADYIREKGLFR